MNYYNEIKQELINNEVYKKAKDYSKNRSDLTTYYNVGKLIIDAKGGEKRAEYGNELIKLYSKRLLSEFGRGYSERNLRNMRKFYLVFKNEIWQTSSAKLTWSHLSELLYIEDINKINYYVKIIEDGNLSVRELRKRIKSNEYERLDDKTKAMLIKKEEPKTEDLIKNPILIKNTYDTNNITEKM